jgi:Holliday junction resolvase-like predicted endonuclease
MRMWTSAIVCCVLGLGLGALLALRLRRLWERRASQARSARGKRGEARAVALLEQHGYEIVERQRRVAYALRVGESERAVQLVLDFVVRRDGEELVAEVKTGPNAPRIAHEATRRQLLEYQLATNSARVLLVDPERATIETVAFPIARPQPVVARVAPLRLTPWLWTAAAIALACWAWIRAQ